MMLTETGITTARPFVVPASVKVVTLPPKAPHIGQTPPPAPPNGKTVDPGFVPQTEQELLQCLADPVWRVCSGQLYVIMTKKPGEEESSTLPFIPNKAQRRLMKRLHHRNIICKARQLGFTTLVAILWLDHALFNANQRCGIIAQDREAAEVIFRDKVKFAYDRLPDFLRELMPLKRDSASELLFAHNNSSVRVATSMRSGTIHRLHVSEYGKICAKNPDKAKEVATGSLPAVPLDGITIIESTAEGQGGDFHDKVKRALAIQQQGKELSKKDFRLHFYAWWQEPDYRMDPDGVLVLGSDNDYFAQIEAKTGTKLDAWQRAWYVATRDSEFSGDPERMWQEYPSHIEEAFQVSTEGTYYAVQLAAARKQGRICKVPHSVGVTVNTFWDIGNSDGTAIWLHQRIGAENRFIRFIEGWGESYSYYIKQLQDLGYVWGTHYLPHDAAHKRQQGHKVASPEDELRAMGLGGEWTIVPVVDEVLHGIQKTRDAFGTMVFDEEHTAKGVAHLGNYRKTWDRARGAWKIHTPSKIDGHSEAADAMRQFAQGYDAPSLVEPKPRSTRTWRTA